MADDVISRLQAVKQAEAEKKRRIAEARAKAEARLAAAKSRAEAVPEEVKRRLAEEEPRMQAELDDKLRAQMAALAQWEEGERSRMREAAAQHGDEAFQALREAFLAEYGSH